MRAMLLVGVQLAFVIASSLAWADDTADRLKLGNQVVVAANVAENFRHVLPLLMAQLKPLVQRQGQVDSADLDKFTKLFTERADAAADQFAEKMAQIYASEFSAEDLANLLAFYKTPTGQNLLSKQSSITQTSFAVGKQLGQDLAKQVLEDINKDKQAKPSKM